MVDIAACEAAVAVATYSATADTQISISKGSAVWVIRKDDPWSYGLCDGHVGYFPTSYLRMGEEAPLSTPSSLPAANKVVESNRRLGLLLVVLS